MSVYPLPSEIDTMAKDKRDRNTAQPPKPPSPPPRPHRPPQPPPPGISVKDIVRDVPEALRREIERAKSYLDSPRYNEIAKLVERASETKRRLGWPPQGELRRRFGHPALEEQLEAEFTKPAKRKTKPPIKIDHLPEAIAKMTAERRADARLRKFPKRQAGRVMEILKKDYGVIVPDNQEKTVIRRIKDADRQAQDKSRT
jgi:hypothetical protein